MLIFVHFPSSVCSIGASARRVTSHFAVESAANGTVDEPKREQTEKDGSALNGATDRGASKDRRSLFYCACTVLDFRTAAAGHIQTVALFFTRGFSPLLAKYIAR
jgi:hypothetical protein